MNKNRQCGQCKQYGQYKQYRQYKINNADNIDIIMTGDDNTMEQLKNFICSISGVLIG